MRRAPFELEQEQAVDRQSLETRSLAELLNILPASSPIPLGIAVQIVVQACERAQTRHELRRTERATLGQVHGPVSLHTLVIDTGGKVELAPRGSGEGIGLSSDVSSLGAILYLLTTGRPSTLGAPGSERVSSSAEASGMPPSAVFERYPRGLKKVVLRALSARPEERFQTASEMRDALVAAFPGYASQAELAVFLRHACGDSARQASIPDDGPPDTFSPSQVSARAVRSSKLRTERASRGAAAIAVAFVSAFAVTLVVSPRDSTRRSAPAAPAVSPIVSLPAPARVEPLAPRSAQAVAASPPTRAVPDKPTVTAAPPSAALRRSPAPTTPPRRDKASPSAKPDSKIRDAIARRYGI